MFHYIVAFKLKRWNMKDKLINLNPDQARNLINSHQLWETYRDAEQRLAKYKGGLSWKIMRGKEYLIRIDGDKRHKSLGLRSAEWEEFYEDFYSKKAEAKDRLASIKEKLNIQARMNKALRLGRVPSPAAGILRELDRQGILGRDVIVVGTYALYAYEAVTAVHIEPSILATNDLDFLMDARRKLKMTRLDGNNQDNKPINLLACLRKTDRSFSLLADKSYCAVNKPGFMVDLIKPQPRPPWRDERESLGAEDDLSAVPIEELKWLQNAPRFKAIAIGEDGWPVPLCVPDPRAFSLYKSWLGEHALNRERIKQVRDLAQARMVKYLTTEFFPHLPFSDEALQFLPKQLRGGE
jgi:hypothetical protein